MRKGLPDLECVVRRNGLPSRQFTRYDKNSRGTTLNPMCVGKILCPSANQENVFTLHDLPCQGNGMPNSLYCSDTACRKRRAVHEPRIQLDFARCIKKSTHTSIYSRVVLHEPDRTLDRIQRSAATVQDVPTRI
jgi:hypothetical protein